MNVPQLLIRADASPEIGAGHVMRCLALAQAWQKRGGVVCLAAASAGARLCERLATEGVDVHPLDVDPGSDADVQATLQIAQRVSADWVVLDHYAFAGAAQADLMAGVHRQACRASVLALDDYGQCDRYTTDVVLNQNISARQEMYEARDPRQTRLLLGCDYTLLRREFWPHDGPAQRGSQAAVQRVLVTMGGSNLHQINQQVLGALGGLVADGLGVDMVVGGLSQDADVIDGMVRSMAGDVAVHRSVLDMTGLMRRADLAVTAGGSTCWEMARFGVPNLMVVLADNQREIANALDRYGCAKLLGTHEHDLAALLPSEVVRLSEQPEERLAMSLWGKRLVDGGGAMRVAGLMMEDAINADRISGQ